MTVTELLTELECAGLRVVLKDGVPVLRGSASKLSTPMRKALAEHRESVVASVLCRRVVLLDSGGNVERVLAHFPNGGEHAGMIRLGFENQGRDVASEWLKVVDTASGPQETWVRWMTYRHGTGTGTSHASGGQQ